MSLHYKTVGRGEPGVVGGGQTKYYPTIVRKESVDFRRSVKQIAELSTLNTADVYAVFDSAFQLLIRHLSQGRTMELGHFGNFSASLKTTGSELPTEVSSNAIKGMKIRFRPSQELGKSMVLQLTSRKLRIPYY